MGYQKSIDCICGNEINLYDFLDKIRDKALFGGDSDNLEEIECDECGSIYRVSASAYVQVDVYINSTELVCQGVMADGQRVCISQFCIGDEVSFADGEYQAENMIYDVSDGVISGIYNALIDENQLALVI